MKHIYAPALELALPVDDAAGGHDDQMGAPQTANDRQVREQSDRLDRFTCADN